MVASLRNYIANDASKHFILILWCSTNALLFYYTFMYYYNGIQFYYLHQMLGYGLCISRASATCINLNSSILLIPMCKRFITYLRGVEQVFGRQGRRLLDCGKTFHIYCAHLLCLMAVVHCGAHSYNAIYFSKYYNEKYTELNVAKYANQNPLLMLVTTLPGITGLLLVATLIIIVGFASKSVRMKKHSRFWTTHHLFTVYYLLLFLHSLDGVIKYQTNIKEHVPGCYVISSIQNSSLSEPMVIPEPEPIAEFPAMDQKQFDMRKKEIQSLNHVRENKDEKYYLFNSKIIKNENLMLKNEFLHHPVVVPEPEPMVKGSALLSNASSSNTKLCKQPSPKFASCPREVWRWLSIPLAFYVIERLMRIIISSRNTATISNFRLHSGDVVELKLKQKGFSAKPGQTILVRCPSISSVELHPFSLTSVPCSSDPTLGIHVKIVGDWTRQLREKLLQHRSLEDEQEDCQRFATAQTNDDLSSLNSSRKDICTTNCKKEETCFHLKACDPSDDLPFEHVKFGRDILLTESRQCNKINDILCDTHIRQNHSMESTGFHDLKYPLRCKTKQSIMQSVKQNDPICMHIEGPLGSAMEDIHKYKVSLCVAGGIGITPFASLLNSFLKDRNIWSKTKVQRLYLFWACKSLSSFQWLLTIIEEFQIMLCKSNRPDFLSVHLYVTGNQDNEAINSVSISSMNRCALKCSRPNLTDIVQNISNRHPKCTVGVFSCGPRGLISALKKNCLRPLKSKTKFVFNKEAF